LVSQEKVWNDDSGTNGMLDQLVQAEGHVGQQMNDLLSTTWRSTVTVSCVPSVTDYGRPDGRYTAMREPVPEMSSASIS
jgi:hypothetical protein